MIRRLLDGCLRPFGKIIANVPNRWDDQLYGFREIVRMSPPVVLDVGANVGQFAMKLRACGYSGRIVSFEPQAEVFRELAKNSSTDSMWSCVNLAVGSEASTMKMHISNESQASSLLKIGDLHLQIVPQSHEIAEMDVCVVPLDEWISSQSFLPAECFVKFDIQGYESRAIGGAKNLLKNSSGVLIELCFAQLYEEQSKYFEIMSELEKYGLRLSGFVDRHHCPSTGNLLWCDGLFVR